MVNNLTLLLLSMKRCISICRGNSLPYSLYFPTRKAKTSVWMNIVSQTHNLVRLYQDSCSTWAKSLSLSTRFKRIWTRNLFMVSMNLGQERPQPKTRQRTFVMTSPSLIWISVMWFQMKWTLRLSLLMVATLKAKGIALLWICSVRARCLPKSLYLHSSWQIMWNKAKLSLMLNSHPSKDPKSKSKMLTKTSRWSL